MIKLAGYLFPVEPRLVLGKEIEKSGFYQSPKCSVLCSPGADWTVSSSHLSGGMALRTLSLHTTSKGTHSLLYT